MADKLTVNREYAAKYAKRKQAEELSRLRDRYGDRALLRSESESSSSEEEDETALGETVQVEKDFLRTLSLVKSKDPRVYDENYSFYSGRVSKPEKTGSPGPVYLRDYERQRLLEKGSLAGVSDSESDETAEKSALPPTYAEEQQMLKESFKSAAAESAGKEEDGGELLTLRAKTEEEKEAEERDFAKWLKGQKARLSHQDASDLAVLQRYWTKPDLEPGEQFLRDYILNRSYIDREANRVPTYEEVVIDLEQSSASESEDLHEEFERSYNFRFEEPGGNLIQRYPRTVGGSVRKEDDSRKRKRQERAQRKEQEKDKKKEELKRLKNLKRKEITEKLEKLKEITGDTTVGFTEADLDGDFDPKTYDAAMQKVFTDDYYGTQQDEGKPVFSGSGEEDNPVNWDQWQPGDSGTGEGEGEGAGLHCEDPEFNMDADYQPALDKGEPSRRRKRRSKLASALQRHKPVFDPEEKTFEQYFDEYYRLDYEDLIGDLPCRFHYRSVVPNDFGLSAGEILACDDKELNAWVSLKKSVQYRTEEEEKRDKKKYRHKARDARKKLQILQSLKEQGGPPKQRKAAKQESVSTPEAADSRLGGGSEAPAAPVEGAGPASKTRKPRKKARALLRSKARLSAARLKSYGLVGKKKKK